jgi:hypothetical protein
VKGRSLSEALFPDWPDWADVEAGAPQAATTNNSEACIKRRVIPVVALPEGNMWGCHTV